MSAPWPEFGIKGRGREESHQPRLQEGVKAGPIASGQSPCGGLAGPVPRASEFGNRAGRPRPSAVSGQTRGSPLWDTDEPHILLVLLMSYHHPAMEP